MNEFKEEHNLQILQVPIGKSVSILVIFGHGTFFSVSCDTAEPFEIQTGSKRKKKEGAKSKLCNLCLHPPLKGQNTVLKRC